MDEEPPKVELSAEEKKNYFRKPLIPDISSYQMGISFGKFSVPEKDEGFEEIKFDWSKEKECKEYVKTWIRDRKSTTRIEDLMPSEWFNEKWKMWQKLVQQWHSKLQYYKQQQTKKAADKVSRQQLREKRKREKEAAAKKKKEEAQKREEAAEKKRGKKKKKKKKKKSEGKEYTPPPEEPAPVEEK